MIRYNPKNWFGLIFHAYSQQVFRRLIPAMIGIGLLTTAVCYFELVYLDKPLDISNVVHSLLGFVLSLFLVFRTNTAYDRWWEGRKQWGGLVNVTRTLAIRMEANIKNPDERRWWAQAIACFSKALRDHLRGGVTMDTREEWTAWAGDSIKHVQHVPNHIASLMSHRLKRLQSEGAITDHEHWLLEKNVERKVDILGACERILKTPIPYSYSMFMKKFIFVYVITLPLGFVSTFAWWTIPMVMVVFYVLVSVELIAEEIEDPFGTDDNDLPLNDLCTTMHNNVEEIFR